MAIEREIPRSQEKNLQNVELVITDWSGVVSDDRMPVYEANARMNVVRGLPHPTFEDWLKTTRANVVQYYAEVHGRIEDPSALQNEYSALYEKVRSEGIHPTVYKDAHEVLESLTCDGLKVVVVSSHPEQSLRREAYEYGVDRFISGYQGNMNGKVNGILDACRMSFVLDLNKALYMGDTVTDIRDAKKAGVVSVGISTGYQVHERLQAENPDFLFRSLTSLREAFKA